jgi:SAM-dependent MidA family methyltransferase
MEATLKTQQKERLKHLEDATKWKREEEEISEKRRKRMLELKDFNLVRTR